MAGNTVTFTDRSGSVAAGGTAQALAPANPYRRGFYVQNLSGGDLWINATGTAAAAAGSIRIVPGALYENPLNAVSPSALSIFGATTGQAFTAKEW